MWWCAPAGLICLLWATAAASESLWLDELHTSWTVSGTWDEVAGRARAGNQSPLFSWMLWGVTQTLGNLTEVPEELQLRLPSLASWALAVCLAMWLTERQAADNAARSTRLRISAWALGAWLMLDRIQLFYATEARVYAVVQLVSLLAWWAVWNMDRRNGQSAEAGRRSAALWCCLSVSLVFLHLTAVLAVFWQAVWGTIGIWRRPSAERATWWVCLGIVAAASAAAVLLSERVWEHREQWSSFAGDASLLRLVSLFPLAAYGVPIAVARGLDRWTSLRSPPGVFALGVPIAPAVDSGAEHRWSAMWLLAAAGPWLTAWCVTALDVAPIFHRRFVIASALPLAMLAAAQLSQMRYSTFRWSAAVGVAAWLIVGQGTLENWRAGHWIGWQRVEGWRQATEYLTRVWEPTDTLWCASGLIEGEGASLPLSDALDRYLSFPFRGIYRVVDTGGRRVEPHALIGDGSRWAQQLQASDADAAFSQSRTWIVYRGSPNALQTQLQRLQRQLRMHSPLRWQIEPVHSFGLVGVCAISPSFEASPNDE